MVTETSKAAKVETMKEIPKGTKSLPSNPGNANNGMKTRTMITVAYKMADLTSIEAFATTSNG